MSLLTRIKELAEKHSFSISEIEKKVGLGNGTIRRWDNSPPSCDKVLKVANLLNVTVDYLLTGKEMYNIDSLSANDQKFISMFKGLDLDVQLTIYNFMKEEQKRAQIEKNSTNNAKIS